MFPLTLVLLAPALLGCVLVARAAARARRAGRPARHLLLAATALGSLCLALPVYAYGQISRSYFMVDEQCRALGAGEFIDYRESFYPVSGLLTCADRNVELVPPWVNPVLTALLAVGVLTALGSLIASRLGVVGLRR